jgi:PKD repeat protein
LTYAWSFGDGGSAGGADAVHAFATPGTRTARLTVTDGQNRTASDDVTVTATASAAVPAALAVVPVPRARDRIAPVLGGLRVPHRLRRGRSAIVRFTVSEAANVVLTFERRSGRRWRKVRGSVRVTARIGANRVRLTGRLSRRNRLKAGVHRLTLVATDAAGNRSRPVRATFSHR